jgi:hypothetical protein
MSYLFNRSHGPILAKAEVTGPVRSLTLQLILDTGATASLLSDTVLLALGYNLASVTDRADDDRKSGRVRPEGRLDEAIGPRA